MTSSEWLCEDQPSARESSRDRAICRCRSALSRFRVSPQLHRPHRTGSNSVRTELGERRPIAPARRRRATGSARRRRANRGRRDDRANAGSRSARYGGGPRCCGLGGATRRGLDRSAPGGCGSCRGRGSPRQVDGLPPPPGKRFAFPTAPTARTERGRTLSGQSSRNKGDRVGVKTKGGLAWEGGSALLVAPVRLAPRIRETVQPLEPSGRGFGTRSVRKRTAAARRPEPRASRRSRSQSARCATSRALARSL